MGLFDKTTAKPDEGHWIGGDEVPALGEGRIKVRSHFCPAAQDAYAYKGRSAPKADRDADGELKRSTSARHGREVMSQVCVLDAEGLPFTADQIRDMLADGGYENLAMACLDACQAAHGRDQMAILEKHEIAEDAVKN